jgi:hypothetical protein
MPFKKKKAMVQRLQRLHKLLFKFGKSKVNNVILLYKNNAKTNKPFLAISFFLSIQGYKRYFTMQIKRKGRKKPLAEDHFLSNFKGKRVFLSCIINVNDIFAPDKFSNDIWIP